MTTEKATSQPQPQPSPSSPLPSSPSSSSSPPPQKQWNARYAGSVHHDVFYYIKCMEGGVISCGLTHTAMTPLDAAKCNMQVEPTKYKGLPSTLRMIWQEEGARALFKGWQPTAIGYSLQGYCKFGFYEIFKDLYSNLSGEEQARENRGALWLAAAASAEVLADIALCPMEMVKVKVQTAPVGTFPTGLLAATSFMLERRKEMRYPYGSLLPLWSRQIPFTMAKFYFFEKIVELFYQRVFTQPKETYSTPIQLGVTFTSGYIAGVICAVVSHPADSIVSLASADRNRGKGFGKIAREVGLINLATKGLPTRILMIGTLTGFQWWIYDTWKTAMGMGTTGGLHK